VTTKITMILVLKLAYLATPSILYIVKALSVHLAKIYGTTNLVALTIYTSKFSILRIARIITLVLSPTLITVIQLQPKPLKEVVQTLQMEDLIKKKNLQ
jgi:hypothetical protein